MVNQATERDEIVIDGNRYRTTGRVQQFLVSRQPGKVSIGEIDASSNPMASEFRLGDFRDGIGVERGDLPDDLRRVWWSTGQLRYKDAFILPPLATQTTPILTAAKTVAVFGRISVLAEFKNEVYAAYGDDVRVYDNGIDLWSSSLRTLAAYATDSAVGLVGGTEMLVIANGTDVDYATDSGTWAENTGQAIKYLEFWGDLLWGITDAGQLYYTDDLTAAWSADARLQLPTGSVTGLLTARGPDRENHLYAVTKRGLFVHDAANARFLETDLAPPVHPEGGAGSTVWRGSIFYPAGNSIYAFQAGSDETIVAAIGPDRDHGMPANKRGIVNVLLSSHNDLLAFVDASRVDNLTYVFTYTAEVTRGARYHHGITTSLKAGLSTILGWNQRGWETKWTSPISQTGGITAGLVSNAYGFYRLWWAANQRIYYMALPVDVVNPLQITKAEYGSGATLETPWFDLGIRNQSKLALAAIMETVNPTSSETVKLEYAVNYVETYTTVATQSETGEKEYRLPTNVDRDGVVFRAWKWRVTLARGSTNTNTPQMIKLTLVWRPRVETLYGIGATLDLTEDYAGVPVVQQFKNLKDSLNHSKLIPVSFRSDSTGDQTYLMDFVDHQSSEQGGSQPYGTVRVTLAEVVSTNADLEHDPGDD